MSLSATNSLGMIRAILSDVDMPRQRFQKPKIQQSKNGSFFIRPWVDIVTANGLERSKKTIVLGAANIGKRGAITKKTK